MFSSRSQCALTSAQDTAVIKSWNGTMNGRITYSRATFRLDRGDAIDLDIERPWMREDIHEHACGRILRKEFRVDAVDGGEHLHRCAIDGALGSQ